MLPPYVVEIIRPGRLSYTEGLRLQERLVRGVQAGRRPEALVLLEHAPVITLGRGAHPDHLLCSPAELAARGLELHESARGGDITYHGPGQLVGYPVLDLNRRGRDLHAYIRSLEELLIRALAELGVRAVRRDGLTGVWVPADSRGPARKIAAIGIRVQRWVTSHGFALNVDPDLDAFGLIVPCGLHGEAVTSIARETGRSLPLGQAIAVVEECFEEVFQTRLRPGEPASGTREGA